MTEEIIKTRVEDEKHPLEQVSFFGVWKYGRTYLNIVYMILLMPLGIFYFTYAVTLFSTFVGLLVTCIGIFLLYFFLITLPYFMLAQGWLMRVFVGIELPKQEVDIAEDRTFIQKSFDALKSKVIWKSLLYFLFIAMPLGIITFTLTVTLISTGLGLTFAWLAPLIEYAVEGSTLDYPWVISSTVRILMIIGYAITPFIGIPVLTGTLHLNNRLSIYHGRLIVRILKK
ncbi:MAG: sensor domain-containing protein [Candidatus Heimdallarchaeota archaeon]